MTEKRIAIIGAGVAGLGPAWQLAKRGWTVEVFEAHRAGSGASSKAAGMLAPVSEVTFMEDQLLQLSRFSHSLYRRFIDELEAESGLCLDYRDVGALLVAVDRDDAEKLEHLYQFQQKLNLPVQRLRGEELRELEPGLSPTINYGLYCPEDHQVDPKKLIEGLKIAFLRAGGSLHENSPIEEIGHANGKVQTLLVNDEVLSFDQILLALGPWTRRIKGLPKGLLPHIRPVRGQMIALQLGNPPLLHHVVRGPDAYLVPRSDGRLIVGATMEEKGFDPSQTAGGIMDLLVGAFEVLPGIYDAPILETWSGFRPISLQNEPLLGPSGLKGLFLSLGHGRNGIVLAPVTAYGLASLIDGDQIFPELHPFLP